MNREDAIMEAERFMTSGGHEHGKCLRAEVSPKYSSATWEIEFAYAGMDDRSPTTDPPSIVIIVDGNPANTRLASLM